MKTKVLLICSVFSFLISCNFNVAGTLGGGKIYRYNCTEEKLNEYLDSIEKNDNALKIPLEWKKYDNWDTIGYDFLKGKLFYIKGHDSNDDEIYYVSVIPPIAKLEKNPGVAVRSVFRTKEYLLGWKYFEDFSRSKKRAIETEFQERVLSKVPLDIVSVDK
ncbi:hypothetical protein OA93_16490 [Flavobacterium sp. KMS]|uniref:hypothetical protein n=1 Tax=Flavobacterium sp. KMS TaxID=1566023 RepID=UPI00057E63A6|nr:hypothetical protein [Flavobacterium sp. KMS]KIA96804.1 hypothetical protein OA93_16490 [Flavobacterium sp. KMS]